MQNANPTSEFCAYFLSLPPLQQAGFFVWPSLAADKLEPCEEELLKAVKPSGLIFFKRNLPSQLQAAQLISELKTMIENKGAPFFLPLVTAIDEEGGRVSRLPPPHERGKSALSFADSHDKEGLIRQIKAQCTMAKSLGINCLLAPVADILTQPHNPVMGDRCFGREAHTVSDYASLAFATIKEQGLLSCAKHFPGHGDTLTDSHKEFCVSHVSLEQLNERELRPFKSLIQQKIPLMMAAHVLLPCVDANYPATLSYKILTQQLRQELGYEGLILSDDLRMNAIAEHYHIQRKQESSIMEDNSISTQEDDNFLKQASLDALDAGCDILLSCQSIVREMVIFNALAQKLEANKQYAQKMLEKAWRIYNVLSV